MEKAKEILSHYITMLMREQGLQVDSDTYYELEQIIDLIVDPLTKRIMRVERTVERLVQESEFNDHS